MIIPTLITESDRLMLRTWQEGDLDILHMEILGDPKVMEFSNGVLSREQVAEWIERKQRMNAEYGYTHWAVERKTDGRLIGVCGVAEQELPEGSFPEVGYRLAQWAWGSGFATEAARAALHWAWIVCSCVSPAASASALRR